MQQRPISPNAVDEEWAVSKKEASQASSSIKTSSLSPPAFKLSPLECGHRRTWSVCHRDGAFRKNVEVLVSGSSFSLHPHTFMKLRALDWTWSPAPTNSKDHQDVNVEDGIYRLQMAPVVFETLINHIVFQMMPNAQDFDTTQLEALKEAAIVLACKDLQEYLQRGGKNPKRETGSRHHKGRSFGPKASLGPRNARLTPSDLYKVALIV